MRQFLGIFVLLPVCFSIVCYNGLKVIQGTSIGDNTVTCGSAAQCYNMSAQAGQYLDVVKAGCSLWRCLFASNRCISTTFQKIPISMCCCNTDRCNQGNAVGFEDKKQITGNTNAEPSEEEVAEMQKIRTQFAAAGVDEDAPRSTRSVLEATMPGEEVAIDDIQATPSA